MNTGQPMAVPFGCAEEELTAAGMACSDSDPCPIYLELSSVSGIGKKVSLTGNLHGASTTLFSVLLSSEDDGATWKEPVKRIPGSALEQIQWLDPLRAWAAGEEQVPLARDPFFLMTRDAGASWRRVPLSEDGGPGSVQRFWFDTPDHGELIVDSGKYLLYETHTGADSWSLQSKTAQMPRLRRAADDLNYRISTDNRSHAYIVERRSGETWVRIASFLVQVANCGARPAADGQ